MLSRNWGIALGVAILLTAGARGGIITGNVGEHGLGHFTGTASYTPQTPSSAVLYIDLTNVSPAHGGFLTGFAMNLPGQHVLGISLTAGPAHFEFIGGASPANTVSAAPYGNFDFGASVGGSFEGGGAPSQGIGVGLTGHFEFAISGSSLETLTINDFLNTPSVGPGDGKGNPGVVVRFRGFAGVSPDSDKVPLNTTALVENPEPSSLILGSLAAFATMGLAVTRRLRRPAR
jgi:hypothetical protein